MPADAVILLALILTAPVVSGLVLLSWAGRALGRKYGAIPPDHRTWIENRWLVRIAGGFLAVYAACFLYGMFVEAHWVALTRSEIAVARVPYGQDRFRIVHLSDLHFEHTGRRERRALELVRAQKPDLILLTGDYLNVREGGAALAPFLESLVEAAGRGVYGIEGNWDAKFPVEEYFRRAGARLLRDETESIPGPGRPVRLAGLSDLPKRTLAELLAGHAAGAFTVFLSHRPDAVDELEGLEPDRRPDLFLCGHTHGGQVRLPFWGAVVTFSRHHKRYEQGWYDAGGVPMYVNRGLGCQGGASPRIRFLCRPEVAVIDVVAEGPPEPVRDATR